MKTIYVVTQGDYSDYSIRAIFSTSEKAENYAAFLGRHGEVDGHVYYDPQIEEWTLDSKPTHSIGHHPYYVHLDLQLQNVCVSLEMDDMKPFRRAGDGWSGQVIARNKEHATQIARDRAQRFQAEEAGIT